MPSGSDSANFTRNLIGGAAIAIATAGAIYLGFTLATSGGGGGTVDVRGSDDEERPPVIVSNGSVVIQATEKHLSNGTVDPDPDRKGKFETIPSTDFAYKHSHKKKDTKSLGVLLIGSSDCGDILEEIAVVMDGRVEILYNGAADPVIFRAVGNFFTFTSKVKPNLTDNDTVATLGDANNWINKVRIETLAGQFRECQFAQDAKPKIAILQHKK